MITIIKLSNNRITVIQAQGKRKRKRKREANSGVESNHWKKGKVKRG